MAKNKLPRYLSPEDWNRIFATCDKRTDTGRRDLAMYLLAWRTGLRVGEVTNLRVKDFNLKTGRIKVPAEGKTGERIVWAPVEAPRLRDALDSWLEVRAKWDPEDESPYFFINKHGDSVDHNQINTTLKRRAKKAGIDPKPVTFHVLRHSFATDMLKDGYTILDVRDALGHKDIATTQVYEHLLADRLEDILAKRVDF